MLTATFSPRCDSFTELKQLPVWGNGSTKEKCAVPRWKQRRQLPACFGMILKQRRKPQSCLLQRRCRGRRNAAQSDMQPAKCDGMALVWRVHRKGAESHRATCTFLILQHFHGYQCALRCRWRLWKWKMSQPQCSLGLPWELLVAGSELRYIINLEIGGPIIRFQFCKTGGIPIADWLVVWSICYFSIYIYFGNNDWEQWSQLAFIFFRGVRIAATSRWLYYGSTKCLNSRFESRGQTGGKAPVRTGSDTSLDLLIV